MVGRRRSPLLSEMFFYLHYYPSQCCGMILLQNISYNSRLFECRYLYIFSDLARAFRRCCSSLPAARRSTSIISRSISYHIHLRKRNKMLATSSDMIGLFLHKYSGCPTYLLIHLSIQQVQPSLIDLEAHFNLFSFLLTEINFPSTMVGQFPAQTRYHVPHVSFATVALTEHFISGILVLAGMMGRQLVVFLCRGQDSLLGRPVSGRSCQTQQDCQHQC